MWTAAGCAVELCACFACLLPFRCQEAGCDNPALFQLKQPLKMRTRQLGKRPSAPGLILSESLLMAWESALCSERAALSNQHPSDPNDRAANALSIPTRPANLELISA
ncbi:unnamed protein product [Effrenium voratum]|uniref:Secreted protein n=1 Tax=Effrenium voratum TaxID=2562239 RepID=A0AA36MGV2_9DINO|nr:unnamed protein product [Effrenium voratum]CAJ1371506.1 unnamed protein product [Effrenium voratum]